MKPNARKNQELIKQYPFVADILATRFEPYDGHGDINVDDLTIKVEKADGDLMFRRANNIGLGDYGFVFQTSGSRKNQVMRRGEYAVAVDKSDNVINRFHFYRNEEEQGHMHVGQMYAWAVLWSQICLNASGTGYLYAGSLQEQTKYIVWITVEAWHLDTGKDDEAGARFGEFCSRSIHITIYGEPDEGFAKLQEHASVYENLSLDSRLMIRGTLDKDHDIVTMGGMLYEMCITFQDEVYFNGMKAVLDGGQFRGASGQFGSVKVFAAEMCGYDRVMLEDAVSWVSFQLRPDSKHMYALGQQGTLPQIRNLVRTVVRMWNQKLELREAFKPDKNVSII